jgi:PAS domain S-box-containing protein
MSGTARELDERLGEGLYKALFDSAVVGLTLCDGSRRIIECNDSYCRIVGRPRDEVIGLRGPDFDEPGQPDITGPPMNALIEGLIESYRAEKRYVRPDGTVIPVRVTMSAVSREADRYVGIVEDLSAVFEAQVELRSQAALLERAQEVGGVGSFVWYPAANRNTWSRHARRIFGFTDEEADRGDPALFFDAVHPDDRERVATTLHPSLRRRDPLDPRPGRRRGRPDARRGHRHHRRAPRRG